MGAYQDFYIDQGCDFQTTMVLSNPDGTSINVAGYVFAGQIKMSYYVTTVSANLNIAVVNAAQGNISISLDAANTSNMQAGEYFYDVTYKNLANVTSRLVNGKIVLTPGVTNIIPPDEGIPAL